LRKRNLLLHNFIDFVVSFPSICGDIVAVIFDQLISFSKLDENSSSSIVTILKLVVCNHEDLRDIVVHHLQLKINEINSFPLIKVALWILGEFSTQITFEESIISIKKAIGSLPLEDERAQTQQTNEEENKKSEVVTKRVKVKTIILPDGTYGTEVINESDPKASKSFYR